MQFATTLLLTAETAVKRDRTGNWIEINISFWHEGTFNFHMSKASGVNIKKFTKKEVNNCIAKIVITKEQPVAIKFNCKTRF